MKSLTMRQRWFDFHAKRLEQHKEEEIINKLSLVLIGCGGISVFLLAFLYMIFDIQL